MKKRLYIIEYDVYHGCGGKYEAEVSGKKPEIRREVYPYDERMSFIERYEKVSKEDYHYANVKAYAVDYDQFEITDKMRDIVESI
jgi:hypothetical protein